MRKTTNFKSQFKQTEYSDFDVGLTTFRASSVQDRLFAVFYAHFMLDLAQPTYHELSSLFFPLNLLILEVFAKHSNDHKS